MDGEALYNKIKSHSGSLGLEEVVKLPHPDRDEPRKQGDVSVTRPVHTGTDPGRASNPARPHRIGLGRLVHHRPVVPGLGVPGLGVPGPSRR